MESPICHRTRYPFQRQGFLARINLADGGADSHETVRYDNLEMSRKPSGKISRNRFALCPGNSRAGRQARHLAKCFACIQSLENLIAFDVNNPCSMNRRLVLFHL